MSMIEQIKQIIEDIGLTYFRSINTKDLNEQAVKNSMTDIGVLAGLIEIDATFQEETFKSVEQWDFTILFLTLAPDIDSPAEQIDDKLSALYVKAHEFLGAFHEILPPSYYLEDYVLTSTDSVNITTEVLIGWELKLSAPFVVNICPPAS